MESDHIGQAEQAVELWRHEDRCQQRYVKRELSEKTEDRRRIAGPNAEHFVTEVDFGDDLEQCHRFVSDEEIGGKAGAETEANTQFSDDYVRNRNRVDRQCGGQHQCGEDCCRQTSEEVIDRFVRFCGTDSVWNQQLLKHCSTILVIPFRIFFDSILEFS